MFAAAIAHHLHDLGIVDYWPTTEGGDCFLEHRESGPDVAVFILPTGAVDQPTIDNRDIPTIQIVTRGPRFHTLASVARQAEIFDALACLDGVTLAAGTEHETWLIGMTPMGAARDNPVALGQDQNQRPEHSSNWRAQIRSTTTNRPPGG